MPATHPMKNKSIEAMIRTQYDLPEKIEVRVVFIAYVLNTWEFEVNWFDEENNYHLYSVFIRSEKDEEV